jgi:3-hydroxyacyl-[acyl-carrier-protein] dehydratase
MNPSQEVLSKIPQKPPFLFVDNILSKTETSLEANYHVSGDEYFFAGHFPDNPVLPAVIMQESLFQTAALLLAHIPGDGVGVVTRVSDGKFKKIVRPGDTLNLSVSIDEQIDNAFYMKGRIKVDGKAVVGLSFVVTKTQKA